MNWKTTKPTEPGWYMTKPAGDSNFIERVTVSRKGRGLSVYCHKSGEQVAMSHCSDAWLWAKEETT